MVSLWLNFVDTVNVSLESLKESYLLAAIFGAVGGTGSYDGGARLGATLALPDVEGIMTPLPVWLAMRFHGKGTAVIAP